MTRRGARPPLRDVSCCNRSRALSPVSLSTGETGALSEQGIGRSRQGAVARQPPSQRPARDRATRNTGRSTTNCTRAPSATLHSRPATLHDAPAAVRVTMDSRPVRPDTSRASAASKRASIATVRSAPASFRSSPATMRYRTAIFHTAVDSRRFTRDRHPSGSATLHPGSASLRSGTVSLHPTGTTGRAGPTCHRASSGTLDRTVACPCSNDVSFRPIVAALRASAASIHATTASIVARDCAART